MSDFEPDAEVVYVPPDGSPIEVGARTRAALTVIVQGPQGVPGIFGLPGEDGDDATFGPPGAQGIQGLPGVYSGATWFDGVGLPSDATGANGDFYVDLNTGNIFQKVAGTWGAGGFTSNTIVQGIPGITGDDGDDAWTVPAAGNTGATGPPGQSNVPGPMGDDGDDGWPMPEPNALVWTRELPYVSNNWYAPPGIDAIGSAATPTLNTMKLFPFLAHRTFTIKGLCAFVTTGQVGANTQLAIYGSGVGAAASLGNNSPLGAVLSSTASIVSTSTTVISAALGANVVISEGGVYWLAMNSDTATVSYMGMGTTSLIASLFGASSASNLFGNQVLFAGLTFAQAFNTWPTFTSASAFTSTTRNSIPAIGFNVA